MSTALAPARAPTPFTIEAVVEGCSAEVYLNDIPVGRVAAPPGNPELGLTIHQLIRNGKNTVELVLEPGDRPSAAKTPREARSLDGIAAGVRVCRYSEGAPIGEAAPLETLVEASFSGDGLDLPVPVVITREFTVDSPFPQWAWERAEPLVMGPRLVAEVLDVLADYRLALHRRDIARENALSVIAHQEIAAAYNRPLRPWVADLDAVIESEWARPDWAMEPIDPDALDLRLVANGRMVQCLLKNWDDAVRSNDDAEGQNMSIPLFLGRVDGALRRLR